jgi:SAM-dependent methyltransferase
MRRETSLDADYFERLYQDRPDPWDFASSAYEAEKYARSLSALGGERARRALELGCSIGVFTGGLARLCDTLVATDVSATALEAARRRCAGREAIEFRLVEGVAENFAGAFDLMVLSEVVYYWDDRDLDSAVAGIRRALAPGGRLLLVHWLGETDYPRSGDDAVTALWAGLAPLMDVELTRREPKYRLDLWRRRAAPQAAARVQN